MFAILLSCYLKVMHVFWGCCGEVLHLCLGRGPANNNSNRFNNKAIVW